MSGVVKNTLLTVNDMVTDTYVHAAWGTHTIKRFLTVLSTHPQKKQDLYYRSVETHIVDDRKHSHQTLTVNDALH